MRQLGTFILDHTEWLYTRLYENSFFFLDYWSINHLLSGALLLSALSCAAVRRRWRWLFALLLGWETLELIFIFVAFGAFRPETLKDQVTDLVVGLLGGWLAERLRFVPMPSPAGSRRQSTLRPGWRVMVMTSVTLAFFWVGHYQYRYSLSWLNSPGICWWAFSLWAAGILGVLVFHAWLRRIFGRSDLALLGTWSAYLAVLLAIEAVGYHLLGIREVGRANRSALVADLVHGTRDLHLFYVFLPAVSVLLSSALAWIPRGPLGAASEETTAVSRRAPSCAARRASSASASRAA